MRRGVLKVERAILEKGLHLTSQARKPQRSHGQRKHRELWRKNIVQHNKETPPDLENLYFVEYVAWCNLLRNLKNSSPDQRIAEDDETADKVLPAHERTTVTIREDVSRVIRYTLPTLRFGQHCQL